LIAWLLAWVVALEPLAERSAHVDVILDPCTSIEPSRFEPQLALEFEPGVVVAVASTNEAPDATRDHAATRVEVGCGPSGLTLALEDPLTAKTMQRELAIPASGGPTEQRTLALAVVEFVRASWLELELAEERPSSEPAPGVVMAPLVSPAIRRSAKTFARRPAQAWTLSLGPRVEVLAERGAVHGGGQLRVLHRPGRTLAWTLSTSLVHGRHALALGELRATLFELGPAMLATLRRGELGLAAGLGAKLGVAHVRGLPRADAGLVGERFTRVYAGAFGLARASFDLPASLQLALELELGVVTRPVRARSGESNVFAVAGPWVGAGIELGFGWPRRRGR